MTQTFEGYEQEFKGCMREFATLADRFNYTQSDDENKKRMIEDMKKALNNADRRYKNMEGEASYLRKENITAKLRKYLMELDDAKKRLMTTERDFLDKMGKKQLFEQSNKASLTGQKKDIKDRYVDANDKAYDQVGLLDDAHKDLLSAIHTTNASNQVLVQDREKLISVDEKNKNINRMLIQAGQKEDKIYTRELCKRCILWIAIIVLFCTDVFLVIEKFLLSKNN